MIERKDRQQSIGGRQLQRATINISGTPEDEDDELLEMMYQMIKNERERCLRVQNGNFVDHSNDSSY